MDPYAIQNTFLYQLSCDMFIQEFLYAAKSPLLYKGIALSRNPMQIAVCASLQTLANVGGYVATGLVSLVSTGPLFFFPLMACLASPISTIAQWTLMQGPQACACHVETCEMAANSAKTSSKSLFQQPFVLPSEQL